MTTATREFKMSFDAESQSRETCLHMDDATHHRWRVTYHDAGGSADFVVVEIITTHAIYDAEAMGYNDVHNAVKLFMSPDQARQLLDGMENTMDPPAPEGWDKVEGDDPTDEVDDTPLEYHCGWETA